MKVFNNLNKYKRNIIYSCIIILIFCLCIGSISKNKKNNNNIIEKFINIKNIANNFKKYNDINNDTNVELSKKHKNKLKSQVTIIPMSSSNNKKSKQYKLSVDELNGDGLGINIISNGTSAEGTNAEGTSAEGTNAEGTNAESTNAEGTSAESTNAEGTNAEGTKQ